MNDPPQISATSVSLTTIALMDAYVRDCRASRAASAPNTPASARFDQRPQPGRRANQRRDAGRGEHADRIARDDDDELRDRKHEALREDAAVRRIDELREQRELEHRDLRIEHRRQQARAGTARAASSAARRRSPPARRSFAT